MLFIYIRKRYKPEGKRTISFFFSKEYRKNGNNRRMKIEKRLNKENQEYILLYLQKTQGQIIE